ncbi:MAG: A/G-specific adenine glycosylase [Rhodothermales bacterium]|jgi:A/G-specific adenine glycosylase
MPERGLTIAEFRRRMAVWFSSRARDLPWRRGVDPYQTWISEVMLQQTRVDQALPYFERFVDAFPDVQALAEADLDEVLLNWEGLGYYSRARNLHQAARQVVRDHGGQIPNTYNGLKELPGIGDYTASAVGSLAFGLAEAVLDGNVIRVLARYDAMPQDVGRSPVRNQLRIRAQSLLDPERPGPHNEAVMELGATVCTPRNPKCAECPIQAGCVAHLAGDQELYPVKTKKAPVPEIQVAIAVIEREDGRLLIQRRPPTGLLGGLWEFPGGKIEDGETSGEACAREVKEELGVEIHAVHEITTIRHAYSHFRIVMSAWSCRLVSGVPATTNGEPCLWVSRNQFDDYAFPRANRRLIDLITQETA